MPGRRRIWRCPCWPHIRVTFNV